MAKKDKILLVVQRYGLEVNGGAELHCRWIAEHLNREFDVEVLTTRAVDYISWKNHYKKGAELINGVKVFRYSVDRERNTDRFGRVQIKVFNEEHSEKDELRWVEENGPVSASLLKAIKEKGREARAIFFWCYRYWHTFHGIKIYPEKSIVVPTAERDSLLDVATFKKLLAEPAGFVFLTEEERELVYKSAETDKVPSIVSACGIETMKRKESFKKKYKINSPFILYVGRIDRNKGCRQLFEYFRLFKARNNSDLKLVLMGKKALDIPEDEDIIYTGFVSEETKAAALHEAELLVMPSYFESLSIILLEAWAYGIPTLANGLCDVLKGQTVRSNAGLYYESYMEFEEGLQKILADRSLAENLGKNGNSFIKKYYSWDKIINDYSKFINQITTDNKTRM